ncbi:hypothetical protein GCM10023144_34510 [Pigmentiphaga soli]|uniref:[Ribosomal protein bS18]-alanine N-acetyltransferase n=1 Tax=Pigmentiphaga soli TaxID=1007095 RepID=A0ABP8HEZ7_9BURK
MSARYAIAPADVSAVIAQWESRCRPMAEGDLRDVGRLESEIYSFPWSKGNFADSVDAGYDAWVVRDDGRLLAYCVMMLVLDEVHLLNISVAPAAQGHGLGRALLDWVERRARALSALSVLLEVRPSNLVALGFYERHGYRRIGIRRGYYPAARGREDAIVMRKTFDGIAGGAAPVGGAP